MRQTIRRPLMVVLLSIVSAFMVSSFLPSLWVALCAVGVAVIAVPFVCVRKTRNVALLIAVPLILAFLYFYLFLTFRYLPIKQYEDKSVIIKGRVVSETLPSENAKYFTLRSETICHGYEQQKCSFDVLVYIPKDKPAPEIGSGVRCTGTPFRDDDFDYLINYRNTVGQYLSVYSTSVTAIYSPRKYDLNVICASVRSKITNQYQKNCSSEASAFLKGLTLGVTDSIPDDVRFAFTCSGVSHVLAVSGMHLAFLTALLWMILSLVTPNLKIRAGLMIVTIWCFTAITGFSPSCCRAAIMLTIFQIGVLIDRESDPFTTLAMAVVICSLPNPMSVFNPSLLLSATATLGIILLMNPILRCFPEIGSPHSFFGSIRSFGQKTVAMSIAAMIGTLPVMALEFQSVSLISPLTNLLILYPIEILFILGLVIVLFGWIPPVRFALRYLCEALYLYCKWVTQKLATLPISTVYTGTLKFWLCVFGIAVIIAGLILLKIKFEKVKLFPMLCALTVICLGIGYWTDRGHRNEICAYYVDVGQGNTTLISHDHTAILVDCGGSGLGFRKIDRALLKGKIQKISSIYVTHMDVDHIRYADNILRRYAVDRLVLPYRIEYSEQAEALISAAKQRETHIDYIADDESNVLWNGAKMEIFTDHIDFSEEFDNKNSLVYKFTYGENELLFVGDITKTGEEILTKKYQSKLACDILEAAHHGSKDASTAEFLQYAVPEISVVSVGDNTYGLPNSAALRRLRKYSGKVLRTDQVGTICITMNKDGYNVAEGF